MDLEGGSDEEIERRICLASAGFSQLNILLWKRPSRSISTKSVYEKSLQGDCQKESHKWVQNMGCHISK